MHTEAARDKFVELRAQGWTLGHIATELRVSKRTLVDWNAELAAEVQSLRAYELDLLKEKFLASREEELNRLTRLQKDVEDELASRPLKHLPVETLFKLAADLRKQIHELCEETEPEPDTDRENSRPCSGRGPRNNGNGHPVDRKGRIAAHETGAENRLVISSFAEAIEDGSVEEEREMGSRGPASAPEPVNRVALLSASPDSKNGNGHSVGQNGRMAAHEARAEDRLLTPSFAEATEDGPALSSTLRSSATEDRSVEEEREKSSVANIEPSRISPDADPLEAKTPQAPEPRSLNHQPSTLRSAATEDGSTPQPSTTHEHCLSCGQELPALLPNGQRPFTHCQNQYCGHPLPPPGTSLREHCNSCGRPLPVHGPNAQRVSNQCRACGVNLPPLDAQAPYPWIPPAPKSAIS